MILVRMQYKGQEINPTKVFDIFCTLYHFGNFENIEAIIKLTEEKGYDVILPEPSKIEEL